ncbi:MAG: lipoyl(octanoyl) transferase [Verrucomicrobiota bacterium]|jgi:lipoate-protein ligase A
MLGALHVYDDPEPQGAALNMGVDEALLAGSTTAILRFYRWRRPSISFGYFGRYAEAAEQSGGREIVRRWTGGGLVPHGSDLTYSIIIPASDPLFTRSSPEIYRLVHEAIRSALHANGRAAELAADPAPKISDACFANAVRADVMSAGRKIAGAAHRRTRAALLHQGSIQLPDLPDRFRHDLAQILCSRCESKMLSDRILNVAREIAAAKYETAAWLRRR